MPLNFRYSCSSDRWGHCKKVLEILNSVNAPINADLVEDLNRLLSQASPKGLLLLNCHDDATWELLIKKKLKQLKSESMNSWTQKLLS